MIRQLITRNTGPAPWLDFTFAPRLNLLTGENGLGTTFTLDLLWWSLAGLPARQPVWPYRPRGKGSEGSGLSPAADVSVGFTLRHRHGPLQGLSLLVKRAFDLRNWAWKDPGFDLLWDGALSHATPANPYPITVGLYFQSDGSVAVWDSYRAEGPVLFEPWEVFQGKRSEGGGRSWQDVCNGMIRDWLDWESREPALFASFLAVLKTLLCEEDVVPGLPTRLSPGSSIQIPTLDFIHGNLPIVLASAGTRRLLSMAYLLVWTWEEHLRMARRLEQTPAREIVLLLDEVDAHLHPRLQRQILPRIVDVVHALNPDVDLQLFATTHEPLVLASAEPLFHPDSDALWVFQREDGEVRVRRDLWARLGDVDSWLTSPIFDLREARSIESERTLSEAKALMLSPHPNQVDYDSLSHQLRTVLPGSDPFWVGWRTWGIRGGFHSASEP